MTGGLAALALPGALNLPAGDAWFESTALTIGPWSAEGAAARPAQRSATASRAPSTTKAPAKTRRSQVITAGRDTTRRRTAAAKIP